MIFKTSSLLAPALVALTAVSACGSTSDNSLRGGKVSVIAIEDSAADTEASPAEDIPAISNVVPIEKIAALICDAESKGMGSEAELFTKTSWMCAFRDDQVRIDEFEDSDQMEEARAMVLETFTSTDPTATLADYPFVFGDLWVAGIDYNKSRDVAIELLNSYGVIAGTY